MKNTESNNEAKKISMLEYAQKKYDTTFDIIEFTPARLGFNSGMNETIMVAQEKDTGIIVNIRERVSKPDKFYDNYINAVATYHARDMLDYNNIDGVVYAKTWISAKSDDIDENILSKENVFWIVVVICIDGKSTDVQLEQLYDLYLSLQAIGYENYFLDVAFTDANLNFEQYVNNYALHNFKGWLEFGNVYESIYINNMDLSKTEFLNNLKLY